MEAKGDGGFSVEMKETPQSAFAHSFESGMMLVSLIFTVFIDDVITHKSG